MSQALELQLRTPAVEINGRSEVAETSQTLLEDSQPMMDLSKKNLNTVGPGAVELSASTEGTVPGAQDFCLNLNTDAQNADLDTQGTIDFNADIRDPAEVEASLAKLEAKVAAKPGAAEVDTTAGISHDLAAVIVGGPATWVAYRLNKETLDPIINTAAKVSIAVNTGTLPKLAENAVNQPITTALEFLACPALPILHASVSATNDALK